MRVARPASPAPRAALLSLASVALLALAAPRTGASPYIDVHVSVKLIRNPQNGALPLKANGQPVTQADLQGLIDTANDSLLASYWRGYRLALDVVEVIGTPCTTCSSSNPSFWFWEDFDPNGDALMLQLEDEAKQNTDFRWRQDAINLYMNQGKGNGAVSSFPFPGPERSKEIVISGSTVFDSSFRAAFPGAIIHHELGHFFNLKHTSNNQPACYDSTPPLCSGCVGADDDSVSDTIEDRACTAARFDPNPPILGWTRDDLARHNFGGLTYAQLNATQKKKVDEVYENNMSYHNGGLGYGRYILYQLTEGQLDYWTDTANNKRSPVTRGKAWFVSTGGSLSGSGSSTNPFLFPGQARDAANTFGGDIILLRAGYYYQNGVFNKPVTLRATRAGSAVIGN